MSTKIYYAWKFKVSKLNEFLDISRKQVFDYAENIIRKLMKIVSNEAIEKQKKKHPFIDDIEKLKYESVIELLTEVSKQNTRKPGLDIDFGWNIWIRKSYCYAIPIGEFKDFSFPDWIKDYSYWNNADKPDNISFSAWERRAKIWNEMIGNTHCSFSEYRLCHEIINLSNSYNFCLDFEMERRIFKMEN